MGRQGISIGTMAICLMLLPHLAAAQSSTTGAIAGVVRDTTGAVMPGVTVEAASPALIEKVRVVVTDAQGNYKIVDLRPGLYSVTFTLPGFAIYKREGIELTTGFTAAANAELKIGSLQETVTVTGASPVVDVQNVRTQKVMSREVLDTVPTGKTIQGYAALTLGAFTGSGIHDVGGNKGENAGAISIHGGREGDQKLQQDGMVFNNSQGGGGGTLRAYFVNQASTQEVTLETSGMSAEAQAGGVQLNAVPKDGGNTVTAYFAANGTTGALQNGNLTDELIGRGLTSMAVVKKIYDVGGGLGGPIRKDKLWFYTAHRWWAAQNTIPGIYFNATQHSFVYTPDLSQPAYTDNYQQDHGLRLTWQVAAKHKVTLSGNFQDNCSCFLSVEQGTRAPEATRRYEWYPLYLLQSTWSYPSTNRLLFQAGATYMHEDQSVVREPQVTVDDIAITELNTGFRYNASAESLGLTGYGDHQYTNQSNARFSVSYVTGSHALKTGLFWQNGYQAIPAEVNHAISYAFRGGVPNQITEWASPQYVEAKLKLNLGLYAQDQWTIKRLTLNYGLRLDYINAYAPAQSRPAGVFTPRIDFPEVTNVPNWRDVNPRLGVAYDVFGNGKTAVKVSLGRFEGSMATGLAISNAPASSIVTSATRTWTDSNGNFVPDCDLQNKTANAECGGLSNNQFGSVNINTRYAADALTGFGTRDYNWEGSATAQQELRPGMAVTAGYFRRWYGNFTVLQNRATAPSDYDPYCIIAPVDARLTGISGTQMCGLYDVNPSKFGLVDNLVTQASNFGHRSEVFNGVDVGVSARFGRGGLLTGGVSTGRTVIDNCVVADTPQAARPGFCAVTPPWSSRTQLKANGAYPLPWGSQASFTFQNLPGIPVLASYVATSAQIAPSLGRSLAAGPNGTAIIDLIVPNTIFEKRLNQLDLRFTKIVRFGKTRVQGMFDVYNVLNSSAILAANGRYGATWLKPSDVQGARLFKFGGQVDF